tara:strand:+ start:25312 stop:26073 length:762 start_codon:yes stop_codon:yes gene_type:complete
VNSEPPLLIIASLGGDFDLAHFRWPEAAGGKITVNDAKFSELDMVEVIMDGMPFLLSHYTAAETGQRFAAQTFDPLFTDLPTPDESFIGVAPRDILTSARHLPEVNQRILLLGKWIGEAVEATAAAWTPSRRITNFRYFEETVGEYLAGGPFPTLFQTSFSEVRDGYYITRGLHYFAGQEIRLTAPPDYSVADVANRLVRIIDDFASHGKIDAPARAKGMIEGETLIFSPSDDLAHVDITIENCTVNVDQLKI